MNKKRMKIAVIGAGMIANAAHIPAWKSMSTDVEVVGVADIRERSAHETAKRYDIRHVYSDPQKMLDELQPDIVSVCTPNMYHKEWTIASLKAGAHVLCEKPITNTYSNAKEMFAVANAMGRTLYTCQSLRFTYAFKAAKDLADAGLLGEIYYSEISAIRRRGIPTWGFFHIKEHNAGGPICDLGVHMVDSLFWIIGNPDVKSVSGSTYTVFGNRDEGLITSLAESGAPLGVFTPRPYNYHEFNVEDFASGYIRLENGGTISIKTSWAVNMADHFGLVIAGTKGGLQLPPLKVLNNTNRYQSEMIPKVPADRDIPFPGHYLLVENLIKALQGEEEILVKPEQVLNVIRTIEGLYRSAEVGREIFLKEEIM